MGVVHQLRRLLWKSGYDICRFDPGSNLLARKQQIFRQYGISVVLDVGANIGQFAQHIRHDIEFRGKIVSFEPLSSAFELLRRKSAGDSLWQVENYALGDADSEKTINIAANSVSSSVLEMLATHLAVAPESRFIGRETVKVKTLDEVFDAFCSGTDSTFLKIDTQGFEKRVLEGAKNSLNRISTVQLEMSLVPLYNGEATFQELFDHMRQNGYELVFVEPVYFSEIPGEVLQVDGMFHRLTTRQF